MPPQTQSATASEDSITSFLTLNDEQQSAALKGMSDGAKSALLIGIKKRSASKEATSTGVVVPKGTIAQDTSIATGMRNRLRDTAKGLYGIGKDVVTEGPIEAGRKMGAGSRQTAVEAGKQAKEQVKTGVTDVRSGLPVEGGLNIARGAVTGASILDPFATGSVVDLNRMQDEGRTKEAIGAGAFDVLMLLAGKKTGEAPTTATKINKLTSAIGETGETVKNLERTLPDIEQTARVLGKPETIGGLADNIRATLDRLQGEFNRVFDPIKSRRAYTPIIKNHIDRILRENPNLMKTPEGRAEVAALRRVQATYDKPWTLEDMNLERSRLRKEIRSLYDAKPTDAAAKLKLDAELKAKKVVADSFSETVNDHLSRVTGKPQSYYDILRQKQEALLDLNNHLDSRVEALRDKQAAKAGVPLHERIKPHAYASGAGPRVHLPFGEAIPAEGVSDVAGRRVREAFGPTNAAKATKASVLALPVSHLATAGPEANKKRSSVTPPPKP